MQKPPILAVGLLSGAVLAYEVLLTRLFSIIQWHHFAYMMISLAMLGWGAAGSLVTVLQPRLLQHAQRAFTIAACLFGVLAVGGYLLAQRVEFNPLQAFWQPREFLKLTLIYLILLLPFLAAATALCIAFSRHGAAAPRLYGADILGAGLAGLGVIGLLFVLPPMRALALAGALGVMAGAVAWGLRHRAAWGLGLAALTMAWLGGQWLGLQPSQFKDLSQTLQIMGTRVVAERSSPLGLITVVESPQVPFRYAPGMSLAVAGGPPAQLGVFVDGDFAGVIDRFDGSLAPLAYLDGLTWAAPYHLLNRPRVLVLGAGGGQDVLMALYHGARSVDAVELDPALVGLVQVELAAFSGRPYAQPGVRVHLAEARAFVAGSGERYDLIQLALVDAFGASVAGLTSLAENHLYTLESLDAYLERLAPGGMLAVTRWIHLPPRELVKLAATVITVLKRRGVAEPGRHLMLLRSWRTGTLLVKNGPFTAEEIEAARTFCRERAFDLDWYPGIRAGETNRYNRLAESYYHQAMQALLGPRPQDFLQRYKYRVAPASDDRPYFFHFFKWQSLPEWLRLRDRGGLSLLEWGYPVLVATLVQAALAGVALILLPLVLAGQRLPLGGRGAVLGYFAGLGAGFMLLEIAFIQRFMLFLGHPLYAVAVVLAGFLVFAGLGSRLAGRLPLAGKRIVSIAALAITGFALVYLAALPGLFRVLAGLPDAGRIAVSLCLIAPLALPMGMPFPLGLKRLATVAPPFIPWAWGINACVSVVAAVLATLLAMHLGFGAVVLLAVLAYGMAALVFQGRWGMGEGEWGMG